MAEDKRILAITQRPATDDAPTPDALYSVGVVASIMDLAHVSLPRLKENQALCVAQLWR